MSADNETTEMWSEYRRAQQQRRKGRLPIRTMEILNLKGKGFDVMRLTDYQFRIDGALDLFPVHKQYHVLKTNQRGTYTNPLGLCVSVLRGGRA